MKGSAPEGATRIVGRAGLLTLGAGGSRILLQVFHVIVARALGPEDFGRYFLAYSIAFVAVDIFLLLNGNAVIRFLGRFTYAQDKGSTRAFVRLSVTMAIGASVLGIGSIYWAAPLLASRVFHAIELEVPLRILALALPGLMLTRLLDNVFVSLRRTGWKIAIAFAVPTTALGALGLMNLLTSCSIKCPSAAIAVGASAGGIMGCTLLFKWKYLKRDHVPLPTRDVARYGAITWGISNLNNVGRWVDLLLVAALLDERAVGLYAVAVQTRIVSDLFIAGLTSALGPVSAGLYSGKRINELFQIYRDTTKIALMANLVVVIAVVTGGEELIVRVFGLGYGDAYPAAVILAIASLIRASTAGVSTVLTTTGKEFRELGHSALAGVISLVGGWILINQFGLLGAALSSLIWLAAIQSLRTRVARAVFDRRLWDARFRRPIIAAACALIVGLVLNYATPDSLPMFALRLFIGLLSYVALLHRLGWDPEDLSLAGAIRRRLWNRGSIRQDASAESSNTAKKG